MFRIILVTVFLATATIGVVRAQAINNTLAYKNISSDGYFRFSYDNDFFAAIDEYYTQGIDAELVLPQFENLLTSKVLLRPRYSYSRYGIGIQHNGYTPSSISSDDILYNDHPFAGVLLLKTFVIAVDTVRKQRFSSSLYGGVIGQAAGAREMQEFIHKGLGNITPHGWQYQVRNDVAVTYQVDYEKQLLAYRKYFSLSASGSASVGTLATRGTAGATLMVGYFDSPFGNTQDQKKDFQLYVYERPEIGLTAYDATLQGGMFNKDSPYTLSAGDISRATFRNRFGVVLAYKGIYLEYFTAIVTKEFAAGKQHGYGGVQIAVTM